MKQLDLSISEIRNKLEKHGLLHDHALHPCKAVCNNCGREIQYENISPLSLMMTLTDSLGGEVLYCPRCGPASEEYADKVLK